MTTVITQREREHKSPWAECLNVAYRFIILEGLDSVSRAKVCARELASVVSSCPLWFSYGFPMVFLWFALDPPIVFQ